LRVTSGFHGGSKCTTESTRRKLNTRRLHARQSGEYRHLAKFAICCIRRMGTKRRRLVGRQSQSSEITFLQNLHTAAQNRVAPVPIARSSISSSQANAEQWPVPGAPRESGSEQETNIGV
jgi:hypothetical protein